MKITIRGNNPITGDNVKSVIDDLTEEIEDRGITIKNMTLYIRFLNEEGKTVDLVDEDGESLSKTVTFNYVQTVKEDKSDPKNKNNVIDFKKKKSKKLSKKDDE